MTSDQVLDRLREELNLPFFNVKVEEKEYSEDEYITFKKNLLTYFEEYVQNVEN